MASAIKVDRNWHGGVELTITDSQGMVSVDYLTTDQVEELIGKLQGTWTPKDEARQEFKHKTLHQVEMISELDGDTRRRELARIELESRKEIREAQCAAAR